MKRLFSGPLMAVLIASAASSAQAATNISLDNLTGAEYDTAGVFLTGDITFTGSTDDGAGLDDLYLQIYDDFALKFDQTFSLAVGASDTFHFEAFYTGLVGTAIPGIGVYLTDGGSDVVALDPYLLPHYADPSQCERDCGPVGGVPEPSSWAMMLLGFGAIGGSLRLGRRKRKIAPIFA